MKGIDFLVFQGPGFGGMEMSSGPGGAPHRGARGVPRGRPFSRGTCYLLGRVVQLLQLLVAISGFPQGLEHEFLGHREELGERHGVRVRASGTPGVGTTQRLQPAAGSPVTVVLSLAGPWLLETRRPPPCAPTSRSRSVSVLSLPRTCPRPAWPRTSIVQMPALPQVSRQPVAGGARPFPRRGLDHPAIPAPRNPAHAALSPGMASVRPWSHPGPAAGGEGNAHVAVLHPCTRWP